MRRFLLALLLLGAAWAQTGRFERVAVVLSVEGPVSFSRPRDLGSRMYELHTLDTLETGQSIQLGPKAVVTLSVLSSGIRYRLSGPLTVPIDSKTPFHPGKGITELARQAGRAGLVASQQIELSKFGGSSSRQSAFPVYTQGEGVVLDLDVLQDPFEASSLKVFYRLADTEDSWKPAQSSLSHHSNKRDQLKLKAPFATDKFYLIYIGDSTEPKNEEAQFSVLCLPDQAVQTLRVLEKSATDLPSQLELYQAYRHLRLFDQAEAWLSKMRKQYPKGADWNRVETELDVARHSR